VATVEQPLPKKGPSIVIQIAILLLMTVAAIGVGWLSGAQLKKSTEPAAVAAADAPKETPKPKTDDKAAAVDPNAGPTLVPLAPLTTNLASPPDTWIRIEVSVEYDSPQPLDVTEQIQQDLLAFVRTVKLHQIEGASGYQHLRDDMQERASIRSGGHVKQLLIRSMLLE
jgi:flagellar FliL protein